METILDNGVTLVKATALAKKYRYTTDYIGQLCRAGKVEAKLIGRAWFVNEESLLSHKNDRYNSTRSSEIIINKSLVSDRVSEPVAMRREVRPVLSKSAHRSILQIAQPKTYNFASHGAERVSTYHQDDGLLEPVTKQVVARVREVSSQTEIDEEAHKINVSLGEKASRKLAFEELPEVLLRGDLKVDSLDDPDLFTEVEPVRSEDIQFTPQSVIKQAVTVTKRYQPRSAPLKARMAPLQREEDFEDQTDAVVLSVPYTNNFVAKRTASEKSVAPVRFVVVPVFVTVAFVVCGVLLGLVSHAESDGLQFRQSLSFSVAAVVESVSKFTESY